jgi:hypothetical protein
MKHAKVIYRSRDEKARIVAEYTACENREARQDVLDRYRVSMASISRWSRGQRTGQPGRPRGVPRPPKPVMTPELDAAIRAIIREEIEKMSGTKKERTHAADEHERDDANHARDQGRDRDPASDE